MQNSPRRTIEDPAESTARLLVRLGLALLFVVSQLAPIVARQTIYILLPIGAVLLLLGAGLHPAVGARRPIRQLLTSPPLIAAVLLAAWTGVSLAWTPFVGPSERFGKISATLALVAAAGAFLPERTRTSNLNLLPIGAGLAALALAALALFVKRQYTLEDILDVGVPGRVGLGLALLVWPAMGALALRGRTPHAAILGVVTLAACLLVAAPNALPAFVAGAAVFALSFGRVAPAARSLAGLSAAIVLLAPVAAVLCYLVWRAHPPHFFSHLAVWGAMIAKDGVLRSLIGHGFGSATYGLLGGYLDPSIPRSLVFKTWFDLGAIGAFGLAALAARACFAVSVARPALAPFLLGGVAATLALCVTGPAAEQLWWLTLAGLDALAFVLVMRGQFRKRRPAAPIAAQTSDAANAP